MTPPTPVPQIPTATKPVYGTNPPLIPSDPEPTPSDPREADPCNAKISQSLSPTIAQVKTFVKCQDNAPVFGTELISIPANAVTYVSKIFERLANIEGQQCIGCPECPDNVHGSPEWWEIRPGNSRPQLLLLFSPEGSNRANYQITIPHWNGEKPTPKNPPLKDYRKGSFMSVVHLADTSKLIINTKDDKEASRVLARLKPIMNQVLVAGGHTNHTQIGGVNIKEQIMTCRYAVYYPEGQKTKIPLWTVKFDV